MNELVKIDEQDKSPLSAGTKIQESKEVAKVQAMILMAKRFPRNENQAYMDIMESCKRTSLANQAEYVYPRGGKMVTGPSIRLAEVLARGFGNMHIEISIVNQTSEKTEAIATAIDTQTNYVVCQGFVVPHQRTTKKGVQRLSDERDIREMVQNIGSRVLRGCILRVIPPDFTEDAVAQCKKTQITSDVPIADQIKKIVIAFDEIGVKVEHLEKRLGHNLDATIPSEIVNLRSIYKSIKDGMADREDFFEISGSLKNANAQATLDSLLEKNEKKEKAHDQLLGKTVNLKTGEVIKDDKK